MKKAISLFMIALMIFSNLGLSSFAEPSIDGPIITSVYADIFGIVVNYDTPVTSSDVISVTLAEQDTSTSFSLGTPTFSDNQMTVQPSVSTDRLTRDINYVLEIDGEQKIFKIETIVNVDFENLDASAVKTYTANTTFNGTTGSLTAVASSTKIAQIVDIDGNKKLYLNNQPGFGVSPSQTDYTLSYNTSYYSTASSNRWPGRIYWHATSATGGNANAVNIYPTARDAYTLASATTTLLSSQSYIGEVIPFPISTTAATWSATALWDDLGVSPSTVREQSFKALGNVYSAYLNGTEVVSLDKSTSPLSTQSNLTSSGNFYYTCGANYAQLVDDVLATICTEIPIDTPEPTATPTPTPTPTDDPSASPTPGGMKIDSIYATSKRIDLTVTGGTFAGTRVNNASLINLINLRTGEASTISSTDVKLLGDRIAIKTNIIPDDTYRLSISSGFGESVAKTTERYNKLFVVEKIAEANFEDMDLGLLSSSAPLDSDDGFKLLNKGTFSEIIDHDGNKKLFVLQSAQIASNIKVSDYNVSFDVDALGTNTDSDQYFKYYFRNALTTGTIGYNIRPANTNATFYSGNSTVKTITYLNSQTWAPVRRDSMLRYFHGSDGVLPPGRTEPATNFAGMMSAPSSTMTSIDMRAIGDTYSLYKSGDLLFSETAADIGIPSGYFRIRGAVTGASIFDNFLITTFREETASGVSFIGDITSTPLAGAQDVSGSAKIINLSETPTSYTAWAAAYDANNKMLKVKLAKADTLSNWDWTNIDFSLTGVSGVAKIRLFVFDNVQNKNLLCKPLAKPNDIATEPISETLATSVLISDFDKSILSVTGNNPIGSGKENVSIILLGSGEVFGNKAEYSGNECHITYATVPEGKSYNENFKFSGNSGKYELYTSTLAQAYGPFAFKNKADTLLFVSKLGNNEIAQANIFDQISDFATSLGVDLGFATTQDMKDYLAINIIQYASDIKASYAQGNGTGAVLKTAEIVRLTENELKFFAELSKSHITSDVNIALTDYEISANIDLTAYKKLSASKKAIVCNKFIGKSYSRMNTFKTDFNAEVKAAANTTNSDSPKGGGGSGGSSVKVYDYFDKTTVDTPNVTPTPTPSANNGFTDIADVAWAQEAISYLADNKIVGGTSENIFAPNDLLTREQFAKMVALAFDVYDSSLKSDFSDIDENSWASSYVASAKKSGFINGINDSNFGLGQNVTRQDMAVILYRAAKSKGKTFTSENNAISDFSEISEYAKEAVSSMVGENIINGFEDGSFAPMQFATRAEAAKLIYSIIKGGI